MEKLVHLSVVVDTLCPAAVIPAWILSGTPDDLAKWLCATPDLILWLVESGLVRAEATELR